MLLNKHTNLSSILLIIKYAILTPRWLYIYVRRCVVSLSSIGFGHGHRAFAEVLSISALATLHRYWHNQANGPIHDQHQTLSDPTSFSDDPTPF